MIGELLFCENSYTDEPYFSHPSDDMYKLYRYPGSRSMKDIRRDLYFYYRRDRYKNDEDLNNAFMDKKKMLKYKNKLLKEKFNEKTINLSSLMVMICEEEIYKMPREFKIEMKDGRFLSYEENDISLVFMGVDGNYYYYEYFGSEN